jgi:hypothetical protein
VLKKIFALMMVLSIFTVNAHAVSQGGLKAAYDELNYALTVEWDQQDKEFYNAQMKSFMSTIRELQAKGLTNAQLVEFAKSEVKDARVAKDLETAFNMISINKMTGEEASKYMMETMKRSYSSGASWNGDVLIYAAVGLLLIAVAVGVASGNVAVGGGGCRYYTECGYIWTTCYDYWGPYSCRDYTCWDVCYY